MRFSIAGSLLSLCLSYTAYAAEAPVAHVYTFDRNAARQPQEAQSVNPETARLIFSQRLGLSQFEELRNADDKTLKQLNWFGGRWQAPFQLETQSAPSRSVILFMESVDFPGALMGMTSILNYPYSHFTMTSPPSPAANADLLSHFLSLAKRQHPQMTSAGAFDAELVQSCFELINRVDRDDPVTAWNENIFINVDILKHYTARDKSVPASKEDAHLLVRTALTDLQKVTYDQGMSLTIALFPPASRHTKRSSNPYGKRFDRFHPEEPLSVTPPSATSLINESQSINIPAPVTPFQSKKNSSDPIIKGILPACFTTKHACQSTTLNCTGHGSCYLKYRDSSKDNKECWSCGCKATVTTNAKGLEKTTNWGGPACQKKDVSVAFWILAGFTVLLVGTISWGVGLLWSMGDEELPSVIGAGVSGPRAK